jgi:hypothetical protein
LPRTWQNGLSSKIHPLAGSVPGSYRKLDFAGKTANSVSRGLRVREIKGSLGCCYFSD